MIGCDYEGISDNHNMVEVVAKKYVEKKHSDAAEPTGSTERRGVVLKAVPTSEKHSGLKVPQNGKDWY